MKLVIAVQSGKLLRALEVLLKKKEEGVSALKGGCYTGYYETSQVIQKGSRLSPSNRVTPFAYKLLPELRI
jgi:hypothetical protein